MEVSWSRNGRSFVCNLPELHQESFAFNAYEDGGFNFALGYSTKLNWVCLMDARAARLNELIRLYRLSFLLIVRYNGA
jgi:hypothetical protein